MFNEQCKDVETVDASPALSHLAFATKDEHELRAMRACSKACVALMTPYFLDEMSDILDAEKQVKHSALAEKVDKQLDNMKWWKTVELPGKGKLPSDLDPTQLDWVLGPAIQSGGKYDLRFASESNNDNLHAGIIIAALGLRYKSYCSTIARTYLVDPNKTQESNYKLLCMVHNSIIKDIRDGMQAKDVYNKALGIIKAKKPEMEKHFLKNVGWGVGLEQKDPTLVLNGKNSRTLKDGMTLIINTGLQDIENPNPQDKNSKVYSLVLTDTIRVTSSEAVVFTAEAPTSADANSFFFKDDEETMPTPKKEKKDSKVGAVATKNITSTRLRSERNTQVNEEADAKRRAHQKELAAKKQKEGMARFSESTSNQNGNEVKKFKRFESYKRDNQFPLKIKNLEIVVDAKNGTVVLPILGRPVPFHINTIKNASKSDEGDFTFLRINFLSPGQGVGRKDDQPFEDASAHFVRSLTFRSLDGERYSEIATQISNMKRDSVKKEQEKKDMEDVVEQDKLVEIRSKCHPCMLDDNELTIKTAVLLSSTTSSFARLMRASVLLARSKSTRTVSGTSRPSTPNIALTFSFRTLSTCSSNHVPTSLLSSFTSTSRTLSSWVIRRRQRTSSSTARQLISSSTRQATASGSTATETRTSSRPSRKSAVGGQSSTVCSKALHRKLQTPVATRVLRSTCPSATWVSTVFPSAVMSSSSPRQTVSFRSPSRPSWSSPLKRLRLLILSVFSSA